MSRLPVVLLALTLSACSYGAPSIVPYMQSGSALRALAGTGAGKITHVVYIVQENRSFDNLFQGYPGADTVAYGKSSNGQRIKLEAVSLSRDYDIDHSAEAMFAACNGTGTLPGTDCRMNGFNRERSYGGPENAQYTYVPHDESKPYFDMAHEWVVADKMFQSQLDESFVAHQYVIAAQADSTVDLPSGKWGCGGGKYDIIATITGSRGIGPYTRPCFGYETLGDELDKAKLSWRFYASAYGSRSSGAGAEWSSVSGGQAYLRRPRLEERRHLAELEVDHRRPRGQARQLHLGHAGLQRLRSRELRRRPRTFVGRRTRQHDRREQVLELDGDLRSVGRLGRSLRSRPAAV